MKKLDLVQMESLKGSYPSPECLASMGGSAVLSGMFLGPVGYFGGALTAYLFNAKCK